MLVLPPIIQTSIVALLGLSTSLSLLFDATIILAPPPSSLSTYSYPDADHSHVQSHLLVYPSNNNYHHHYYYAPQHPAPTSTTSFWLASSKLANSIVTTTKDSTPNDTIFSRPSKLPSFPNFLRRYNTANEIPISYFTQHKVLRGNVVRIIDGDTIRIRHTPFIYSLFSFDRRERKLSSVNTNNDDDVCSSSSSSSTHTHQRKKKKISECTISVRLYGVDAPETAKFGYPGQPFSMEAKEFILNEALNKVVLVKLLSKDQYSRVVGSVSIAPRTLSRYNFFFVPSIENEKGSDLSMKLIERGYATLYTGKGAQYNDQREELMDKMERAKEKRIGIWSIPSNDDNGQGEENSYVNPAVYKRAMKLRMKQSNI